VTRERDPLLHWGSGIVALGALGLLVAAAAILPRHIDTGARIGRHVLAGGLAIVCLSVVEVLIALIPLRRGEMWAFWAAAAPPLLVGVPVVVVDAIYVAPASLFVTLATQVFGLAVSTAGLALCGMSLFRPPAARPTSEGGPG
jgi:hypothetical protein